MSVLTKIRDAYLAFAGKGMGSGGAPISGGWAGGGYQDAWSTRRLPNPWELLQMYKGDAYSCASINAQAVASQTLRVYVTTAKNEQPTKRWQTRSLKTAEVKTVRKMCNDLPTMRKALRIDELVDHPILDLLAAPNEFMDGFRMMELTDLYLEMTGVAYWYKERDGMGMPAKLWLVPTTEMYPVRDQYGYTVRYEAVRSKKAIPVEDVVFFSFPDLFAPYSRGKGPAQAGWGQITLQDKAESYNHSTMENRGRPDMIVIPKEALGNAEATRLEARMNRKYRRAGAGGVMVSEQAVTLAPTGFSNKDLEMFQLQEASKLNTANNFNVPISFLKSEDVNRANADAGHYQHAKLALRPRCLRIAGTLNLQLAPDFDARIALAYDDPVPVDTDTTLKERESNLNNALTTVNEEREEIGMPAVEWGEKPWIPVAKAQPMDDEEKAAQSEQELEKARIQAEALANKPKEDGSNEPDQDEETKRYIDSYCCDKDGKHKLKITAPTLIHEKAGTLVEGWGKAETGHTRQLPGYGRLQAALKNFFRKQQRKILDEHLGKSLRVAIAKAVIPTSINLDGWDTAMAKELGPIIQMYYEDGGSGLNARLGLDKQFDVTNPRVADAIKRSTMKFCAETNKATSLELNDALDQLRKDLASGLLSRENTTTELTKWVSAIFDKASKYRAETIAMSESSRALHAGQALAAKESGLQIKFKWLLSQDACPLCQEIAADNDKGVDAGELFAQVGDGPYSDIPYPPAHPRCQCTITEEVVGEKPKGGK